MTTSRKPDPARRPGTGRQAAKPPTGRITPVKAGNNSVPILLGAGGGGLLLLILVIALSGGDSKPKSETGAKPKAVKADVPKPFVPDVSALEAVGKQKCEEGQKLVEFRLNPDPGAAKEQVRTDLEKGLKLLKDGLEAYQQAIAKANKSYPLASFKKAQAQGIKVLCTDIEKEGTASCEQGLKLIQATEPMMLDTAKLTDDEKKKLKADLQKGMELIREGMNLFDRSNQVSDRSFETMQYSKARKAAAMKIGELQ